MGLGTVAQPHPPFIESAPEIHYRLARVDSERVFDLVTDGQSNARVVTMDDESTASRGSPHSSVRGRDCADGFQRCNQLVFRRCA